MSKASLLEYVTVAVDTLPETNSSPLKMDGWKMKSPFQDGLFSEAVGFRRVSKCISAEEQHLTVWTLNFSECFHTTPEEVSELEISLISLEGLYFGEASFRADILFSLKTETCVNGSQSHKGDRGSALDSCVAVCSHP